MVTQSVLTKDKVKKNKKNINVADEFMEPLSAYQGTPLIPAHHAGTSEDELESATFKQV